MQETKRYRDLLWEVFFAINDWMFISMSERYTTNKGNKISQMVAMATFTVPHTFFDIFCHQNGKWLLYAINYKLLFEVFNRHCPIGLDLNLSHSFKGWSRKCEVANVSVLRTIVSGFQHFQFSFFYFNLLFLRISFHFFHLVHSCQMLKNYNIYTR